jgi:hypothetical protein
MTRTVISFSGGRTSAYMGKRLLDQRQPGDELLFIFANTGQEHENTLRFVDACDKAWGLGVVWVEAAVQAELGASTKARVVSFETASRGGEPFEAVIAKYGIPNKAYPTCNRELKLRPIYDYIHHQHGWDRGSYQTAIGIRADEADRMVATAKADGIIYPLIKAGVRKEQVLAWWARQSFDLDVPEHLGNCTWCWKKSQRKHLTLATDHPEVFDFPARMEALYPFSGAGVGPRRFFRQGWTTLDIMARAKQPFDSFVDRRRNKDPILDDAGACSESCDIFADNGTADLFGEAA